MIIEKEIWTKMPRDILYLVGKINLDFKHLIKRIEQGIKISPNNYKTNVQGKMTDWEYFNKDSEFLKFIYLINDKLDEIPFIKTYELWQSWGLREDMGDRTMEHDHEPAYLSGVIYVNDHGQILEFPELKRFVKPEKGKFVLFSSCLKHKAARSFFIDPKYAISFNIKMIFNYT